MKTKELELLKKEDIQLGHYYTRCEEGGEATERVGAFGLTQVFKGRYNKFVKPEVGSYYNIVPKLEWTVKTLGLSITLNVILEVNKNSENTTIEFIQKEYPKVGAELDKLYVKGWLEEYNKILIDRRKVYTDKIDLLHKELVAVHTDLGYKADLVMLDEIDTLWRHMIHINIGNKGE